LANWSLMSLLVLKDEAWQGSKTREQTWGYFHGHILGRAPLGNAYWLLVAIKRKSWEMKGLLWWMSTLWFPPLRCSVSVFPSVLPLTYFFPHEGTESALVWDAVRPAMLGLGQFKAVSSFTTGPMWDVRGIISSLQAQSSPTIRMAKTAEKEVYMSLDLWCSWWSRLRALERDNNLGLS